MCGGGDLLQGGKGLAAIDTQKRNEGLPRFLLLLLLQFTAIPASKEEHQKLTTIAAHARVWRDISGLGGVERCLPSTKDC